MSWATVFWTQIHDCLMSSTVAGEQSDFTEAANHYPGLFKTQQQQKMTTIHYTSSKYYSSSCSLIR